jgi:hypothetical protein
MRRKEEIWQRRREGSEESRMRRKGRGYKHVNEKRDISL